jgi:hypothetical protein
MKVWVFDFELFRVWPWTLTTNNCHVRSKIVSPFESPYMTSYLTSIDTFSLSRTVPEIFDFKVFRVRSWLSNLKDHVRSKIYSPFERKYMTSYLISIDTVTLSRTVTEIFDFKFFRVRPWPLTPNLTFESHVRSKMFTSFESPYMTSYSTSINNCSLSRSVPEIFDFKVFRVQSWLSTLKGHVRSKIFTPFESPYMTFYLTSIDTFYLVPFLRYLTSKILGFYLDLWPLIWPLKVMWGQKYFRYSKAHIW